MSKQKRSPREDRRRRAIEINLLSDSDEGGMIVRARRGCSLPFIGGALAVFLALLLLHPAI